MSPCNRSRTTTASKLLGAAVCCLVRVIENGVFHAQGIILHFVLRSRCVFDSKSFFGGVVSYSEKKNISYFYTSACDQVGKVLVEDKIVSS